MADMNTSVERATTTLRDRARVSENAVTAYASNSQIRFGTINLPSRVRPGVTIDADATLINNATVISPTDPNACNPGKLFVGGLNVNVRLEVDGFREDSNADCVPGLGGSKKLDLSWVTENVDESKTVQVTYIAEGTGDGRELARKTYTVTVEPEAPTQDEREETDDDTNNSDDQNSNGGGPWLPCFLDPNRACSPGEQGTYSMAAGALGVLLILSRL